MTVKFLRMTDFHFSFVAITTLKKTNKQTNKKNPCALERVFYVRVEMEKNTAHELYL